MNKNLKEAIAKGKAEKAAKDKTRNEENQKIYNEYEKMIQRHLPAARKWIKEVLFKKIAEEEAKATNYIYRSVYLGSGTKDGIPVQAIYEAAKKVKGLKPTYNCPPIYENAEFQGCGEAQYSIGWESIEDDENTESD